MTTAGAIARTTQMMAHRLRSVPENDDTITARGAPRPLLRLVQHDEPDVAREDERVDDREVEDALSALAEHGVSLALELQARRVWRLVAATHPPTPEVEVVRDEAVRFVWSFHDTYVHLDVLTDGCVEWFFRDRVANSYEGTETTPHDHIPSRFFERLSGVQEQRTP